MGCKGIYVAGLNRRSLITGLISFVAAPAIVRASSLMPVKAIPWDDILGLADGAISLYGDLTQCTWRAFEPLLLARLEYHARQNPD